LQVLCVALLGVVQVVLALSGALRRPLAQCARSMALSQGSGANLSAAGGPPPMGCPAAWSRPPAPSAPPLSLPLSLSLSLSLSHSLSHSLSPSLSLSLSLSLSPATADIESVCYGLLRPTVGTPHLDGEFAVGALGAARAAQAACGHVREEGSHVCVAVCAAPDEHEPLHLAHARAYPEQPAPAARTAQRVVVKRGTGGITDGRKKPANRTGRDFAGGRSLSRGHFATPVDFPH
jgi:hypothetical protein